MKIKKSAKILSIITIGTVVALTFSSCSKEKRKKIVMKGSTTLLPIAQKTAEEYRKIEKISISIDGSGSGNGIKALLDNNCDIANSSREITLKEKAFAKKKGIEIKEITVAYDMIVPVVHPSNPVKNLSLTQLKAIYDGSIVNWKEVGGEDKKIVVISRDTSSGTYEVWHKLIMKKSDVRKDALLQASNGAIMVVVSGNKKAIGYVGFGYINDKIKPVKVNGIVGTLENGKTGKFPISRKLYMYVNKNKLTAETEKYLQFVTGKAGQKFIEKVGFISL